MVEERDAHTWVEVYFPGYGWIEFEPTASQAPVNRVDDSPLVQRPTPTAQASPTPTSTPTSTPTTLPTLPPPANSEGRTLPTITPSLTPTSTATPTPIILPTAPPLAPVEPQNNSLLAFLMPLLRIIFVVAMLIVLLLILGAVLYWWWEWRGMRGYSPIVRAYARLERYIGLIGIRLREDQTPAERRQRIVQDLPAARTPVTAITDMYTAERYGRGTENPFEAGIQAEAADDAWTDARGNILRRWLVRLIVPWRRKQR